MSGATRFVCATNSGSDIGDAGKNACAIFKLGGMRGFHGRNLVQNIQIGWELRAAFRAAENLDMDHAQRVCF